MKAMLWTVFILSLATAVFFLASAMISHSGDWDSSPHNWDNSPNNWANSPNNWDNSPNNYENSQYNYNNDRIIRDNTGSAQGYAVPKPDGGVNFYGTDGTRTGYLPPKQQD